MALPNPKEKTPKSKNQTQKDSAPGKKKSPDSQSRGKSVPNMYYSSDDDKYGFRDADQMRISSEDPAESADYKAAEDTKPTGLVAKLKKKGSPAASDKMNFGNIREKM